MFDVIFRHLIARWFIAIVPRGVMRGFLFITSLALAIGAVVAMVMGNAMLALVFGIVALVGIAGAYLLAPARRSIEDRRVRHRGAERPAYVVAFAKGKALIAALVGVAMTAMFGWLLSVALTVPIDVLPGPIAAALMAAFTLWSALVAVDGFAGAFGDNYVAVIRDGVLVKTGLGSTFVPWAAITEVGIEQPEDPGAQPFVFLRFSDRSRVVEGPLARVMRIITSVMWMRWGRDAELRFAATRLAVPEEDLLHLLTSFLEDVDARARIGARDGRAALTTSR